MNRTIAAVFALFGTVSWAFSNPSEEENIALVDRVETRLASGDTAALTDLAAVPGKFACPALLAIFKKNRTNVAVTSRCAQLLVTVPDGEEFTQKLLNREAADNPEFSQQEIAINCLVLNHDKTSVRILARTLDYFNPKEMGPIVLSALAALDPPGSPILSKDQANDAEALAKWKEWWTANKEQYAAETAQK